MDLSFCLRAIISQRLVPGLHGKRVPAVEVMLNSPFIADLIRKGAIDRETAVRCAESHTDVGVRIRLHEGAAPATATLRMDSSI